MRHLFNLKRPSVYLLAITLCLSAFPGEVFGQTSFKDFVHGTFRDLVSLFVLFLFSVAFLMFLWGMAKFILKADNETERAKGKQVMIWGLIALFLMLSIWGVVHMVTMTFFDEGEIQFFFDI